MIWFSFGYILSIFLIYNLIPIFFEYNFKIENAILSVGTRTNIDQGNSFFTQNLILSVIVAVVFMLIMIYRGIFNIRLLVRSVLILFIIVAPLLIHPLFLYSGYAFLIGMLSGSLKAHV